MWIEIVVEGLMSLESQHVIQSSRRLTSIRQSRVRALEASPNPSHFSLVSNSPDVSSNHQQVMSPNPTQALPEVSQTSEQQQQQQQHDTRILIQSLSQISIPETVLANLQHLANINLGGIQDSEALKRATETLAHEISSRTERLAAGVQAVAQMAHGIRDGAVVLEQRAQETAEAQAQDRQVLQSVQRGLHTLETAAKEQNMSVDRRVEALEAMVLKLQGELQQVAMSSGVHSESQADARNLDTRSAETDRLPAGCDTPASIEELASLRAQVEQLGDSVSNAVERMQNEDKRLRTALHRLDELETVSAKLRKKDLEIEQAMEERFRLMTSGVLPPDHGDQGRQMPSKPANPGSLDAEPRRQRTEWHYMSPDMGDQPGGDDLGWYDSANTLAAAGLAAGTSGLGSGHDNEAAFGEGSPWELEAVEGLSCPEDDPRRALGTWIGVAAMGK